LLQPITADTLRSESQEQKKKRKEKRKEKEAMESKNAFSGDDKPVNCT
jgi:hypothetical protein